MCLISVLPKGTKKNTKEVHEFIRSGYECNKQGSGFMYRRENSKVVNVIKGFFTLDSLMNTIEKLDFQEGDELVVHHRISTSGLVNDLNCHPFVISDNHDEVIMTAGKTKKPVIVHNGVFHGLTSFRTYNDAFSDTYTFAKHIISNKHVMNIFREDKVYFKHLLDNILYNSKFVILQSDKPMEMFGEFIEKDGYFHSNDGYCKHVVNVGGFASHNEAYSHRRQKSDHYDFWNSWDEGYRGEDDDNEVDLHKYNIKPRGLTDAEKTVKQYIQDNIDTLPDLGYRPVVKKDTSVVLDNSLISLNEENCFHFYYVNKKKWDDSRNKESLGLYTMKHLYDPEVMFVTMTREEDGKDLFFGFSQHELINETYYIPKTEDLKKVYRDLLALVTCPIPVSKTSVKKLDKLLAKVVNKNNYDYIMYHRIEKMVTKLSLLLYKKYLEENNILESVAEEALA